MSLAQVLSAKINGRLMCAQPELASQSGAVVTDTAAIAAMQVPLLRSAIAGHHSLAIAGHHSLAIAGHHSLAIAGHHSLAIAGHHSLAIAGHQSIAARLLTCGVS